MPSPSTACQTCKTRRIKCDGAKPTCQRCVKSRRFCLDTSTTKQASFSIHIENCYAAGEIKRPRGPRSGLTLYRPQYDLRTRALAYYLNYHLQTLTDAPHVLGCLSEAVSDWRVSGRSCGMVDLALSSTALAVFSRTQHHPPAATEASSRYYRLLRVAQGQISQVGTPLCDERNIDACLLAVLLMGRYEGVMYHPDNLNWNALMSSKTWSHHDGAMAILKVWKDNANYNSPTCIIKETRRGLVKFSLLRDLPLPDWILDGKPFGEHDLDLEYDRITVRIVKLRDALVSLERKTCLQIAEIEELGREARELDEGWQEWADQCPGAWSYQIHTLVESGPCPRRHFYSSTAYSYSRPGYAAVWSQYFTARMLINSTRIKILELLRRSSLSIDPDYEQQRLGCIAQVKAMANNLASTIPFSLEKFRTDHLDSPNLTILNTNEEIKPYLAVWTLWPLAIASSLEGIDVQQQLWFRSELAIIGKVLGNGVLSGMETAVE